MSVAKRCTSVHLHKTALTGMELSVHPHPHGHLQTLLSLLLRDCHALVDTARETVLSSVHVVPIRVLQAQQLSDPKRRRVRLYRLGSVVGQIERSSEGQLRPFWILGKRGFDLQHNAAAMGPRRGGEAKAAILSLLQQQERRCHEPKR